VNNSQGDRNLICTCPPIEMYEDKSASNGKAKKAAMAK